jgi:hypothetical protein
MVTPTRIAASVLLVCMVTHASGQADSMVEKPQAKEPGRDMVPEQELQRLMQREHAALEAREHKIDAELKEVDQATMKEVEWAKEWAGTYYTGDGLGMNVTIKVAPKSGITYTWHGCMGLYDANHGEIVEVLKDGLCVKLAIDESASQHRFMSSRLYFVKWGDRRYLVPKSQMTKLVNNYNQGSYARSSMYSIPRRIEGNQVHRRWDEPVPAGQPQLPPEYSKLIAGQPVNVKITKVTTSPLAPVTKGVLVSTSVLELEGGRDRGIFVGMEIDYRKGRSFGSIEITRVRDATCSAKVSLFLGENEQPEPPEVGMEFSLPGADKKPRVPNGGGEKHK